VCEETNEDIRILNQCMEPARELIEKAAKMVASIRSDKAFLNHQTGATRSLELRALASETSVGFRDFTSLISSPRYGEDPFEKVTATVCATMGYGFELVENNWLRGVLPLPLNARSKKGYWEGEALKDQIQCMIWHFLGSINPEKRSIFPIDPAAVVFKYMVSEQNKQAMDYDNMDIKDILNVIKYSFIRDDSMQYIKLFNCSMPAETSTLIVYILPETDFGEWIKTREKIPEKRFSNPPENMAEKD